MLFLLSLGCTTEVKTQYQVAISATELDFEEVPIGTWLEKGFFIENTGDLPVTILSSGIVGASESLWSLSSDSKSQMNPGDYLAYTLRFTPNQLREEDVRVQIRMDIEDLSTLYVNGLGVGGLSIHDLDDDGYSPAQGDCNDAAPDVYPDAVELCDGVDNDCDGGLPDEEEDVDADGHLACSGDCDDFDNTVYPEAPELCDDKDNDCDGLIPDRNDLDADGQTVCDGDCDDGNADRWYGNPELCNYLDSDCNGLVDDIDGDGDGHSMCPSGGDCDDANPLAYPVVLDTNSIFEEGDGSPAYPYKSFNAALENIDELCRTIMVAPGTHQIQSTIIGGYVHIRGAGQFPEDSLFVQWSTTPYRMLTVKLGAVVQISNLTFFGSTTNAEGSALMVKANGTVYGEDLYFIDNDSLRSGGAVYVYNSSFSCDNCEFINNITTADGGAIYAEFDGNVELSNSLLSNNSAQQGGAISVDDSTFSSEDVLYSNNYSSGEGGALAVYNNSMVDSLRDRFMKNSSDGIGGAIVLRSITTEIAVIKNAQFQDNLSYSEGGAIAAVGDQSSLLVANSTFVSNFAASQGSDLYFSPISSTDGLWVFGNISHLSYGEQAFYVTDDLMSSFAFNSCTDSSTGLCYQIPLDGDAGFNNDNDPLFVSLTDDNDPDNDDLTLQTTSLMLNSGPLDGFGPWFYTTWSNPDGSQNHRGHTGGPNSN